MVEQQRDDPVRRFFREPVTCPLEYFETVGPVDKASREQCGFAAQGAVFTTGGHPYDPLNADLP